MSAAPTLEAGARVARRDHLPAAEVDGEVVMLDVEHGTYFGLGGAGSRLWALLAQPRSLDELVRHMGEAYVVDEATCRADVRQFVQQLMGHGLVALHAH